MSTNAAAIPPLQLDLLIERAAGATRRSADSRKKYARALARNGKPLHRNGVYRHFNGIDPYSPAARSLRYIYQLAAADGTRAWAQICEEAATVRQVEICRATTEQLIARWQQITEEVEHDRERDQNRATYGSDAEAAALADLKHAEVLVERAAIRRELALRRADPRRLP